MWAGLCLRVQADTSIVDLLLGLCTQLFLAVLRVKKRKQWRKIEPRNSLLIVPETVSTVST
jgi:hypothetical protein